NKFIHSVPFFPFFRISRLFSAGIPSAQRDPQAGAQCVGQGVGYFGAATGNDELEDLRCNSYHQQQGVNPAPVPRPVKPAQDQQPAAQGEQSSMNGFIVSPASPAQGILRPGQPLQDARLNDAARE